MKKIVYPIVFLLVVFQIHSQVPNEADNEISIATFNVRIFSTNSRNDEELYQICNILKEFDFIALQEVGDQEIIDRTVAMLKRDFGLNYFTLVSKGVGRGVKERYAFIFRADKVVFMLDAEVINDDEDLFIREPFYAKFKAGKFDFWAITIRSIYGDRVADRRAEALLLDDVYRFVQDLDGENDILLMGDFNLSPDDSGFVELSNLEGMMAVNTEIPTSIKDRLYDNIWFQKNYTQEYTGKFGVFKFDEDLYGNDDKAASLAVSDHRPLWAIFDTSADDD